MNGEALEIASSCYGVSDEGRTIPRARWVVSKGAAGDAQANVVGERCTVTTVNKNQGTKRERLAGRGAGNVL